MTQKPPERLDWYSAVGYFILNFGVLDWHMFVYLESKTRPEQFVEIKGEHFGERVERVQKLLSEGTHSAEQKQSFAKFFARLHRLRDLRNRIAHGMPVIQTGTDGKHPVLRLSLPKDLNALAAPASLRLEFSDLTNALNELTALIEEFQALAGGWVTSEIE